jgi:cobalt/nickel transport system ATP-binding protein
MGRGPQSTRQWNSTNLDHLNATLFPADVKVVGDGTPITEKSTRKDFGFVFQDADTQLVAPTVLDDVLFGLQNYDVLADEAEQRARKALETVDTVTTKSGSRLPGSG